MTGRLATRQDFLHTGQTCQHLLRPLVFILRHVHPGERAERTVMPHVRIGNRENHAKLADSVSPQAHLTGSGRAESRPHGAWR